MSRASGLHRLQEIDSDSDRLKGRLEEIRITLEDSSEIAQLKADLDARLDNDRLRPIRDTKTCTLDFPDRLITNMWPDQYNI